MEETPFTGNGAPGVEDFTVLQPSFANMVTLWCATQVLKCAGFDKERAARALKEVYGVEVPKEVVAAWFASIPDFIKRACASNSGLSRFVQLVQTGRLSDCLWALRYVAGAAVGDGDKYGRLRVKDWCFTYVYSLALAIVTGDLETIFRVRRTNDGRFCVGKNCLVGFIVSSGLWRILMYLDKFDEIKHFLAGLMDAEGSISPHISKGKLVVQICFGNTNAELVRFVEEQLRELGLKPYTHSRPPKISSKIARRKTVHLVHARISFSKLMTFAARVGFRCTRKLQLLGFFILVAPLPPALRYQVFLECWKKGNGRWKQVKPLLEQLDLRPERRAPRRQHKGNITRHQRKVYVVKCPVCRKPGTLTLNREVIGGKILIQAHIRHDNGACTLNIAEKEIINNKEKLTSYILCKCGKPGYVYVAANRYITRRKYSYNYLRVAVYHRTGGKAKSCKLMSFDLLEIVSRDAEGRNVVAPTSHPMLYRKP